MGSDGRERGQFRRRLVGLYALTAMERDGPLHGYALSERMAERTHGAWRPGPGAVYPSLRRLSEEGLARARPRGRRRVFEITPKGRRLLALVRQRRGGLHGRPDLSPLWAEILGSTDVSTFLVDRLESTLDQLNRELLHADRSGRETSPLRRRVVRLLASARRSWADDDPSSPSRRRSAAVHA